MQEFFNGLFLVFSIEGSYHDTCGILQLTLHFLRRSHGKFSCGAYAAELKLSLSGQ